MDISDKLIAKIAKQIIERNVDQPTFIAHVKAGHIKPLLGISDFDLVDVIKRLNPKIEELRAISSIPPVAPPEAEHQEREKAAAPQASISPEPGTALDLDDKLMGLIDKIEAEYGGIGISDDSLAEMEAWIKSKVSDRVLTRFNQSLTALGKRKLNYQDIAAIALIHKQSVKENDGYSPEWHLLKP